MSNTFVVNWIQTRSDVPLYFNPPSGPVALPTGWKVVWQAPNIVTPYSAAAFKLTAPTAIIGLAVDCSFGSSFVGKNLLVQGYLNGVIATSSPVTVPNTGRVVVQSFVRSNPRGSPIAYRGSFQWRLVQGSAVVATFDTLTPLEFYSIVPPPAGLWPSYGVSVDLLREYVPVWSDTTNKWMLASFYRFITQKIFGGPFVYDNIRGANRYALNHLGSSYKLEQYFRELRSGLAIPINCYDMAGIVQIVLSLFPDYNLVRWNFMQPYGWIYTTRLKGWTATECNNPFWGNSYYYPNSMAPFNPIPNQRERSHFGNHAYIVAPSSSGPCILDATSGPHTGDENLQAYLANARDYTTTYYAKYPGSGPGTSANISPTQTGISSIINVVPTTVRAHASEATATSSAVVEGIPTEDTPSPGIESAPFLVIEGAPVAVESSSFATEFSSVDRAMERAKVTNADLPRFSRIDPITLESMLEQKSKLKLTFEAVELVEIGSELQLSFGTFPDAVEVTFAIVDSHEATITAMRQALSCISAPLDVVFAQTAPLGQYSLQGIGGGGYILFVRGNIFVKMIGLASCEELGTIATEVDKFLKGREGSRRSLPKPRIELPETPGLVVKVGETFEVAVKVADAASMTAFTDAGIVQLLEVDVANTTFKFHGTAAGVIDIRLVFAQKDTLQTATTTVHVEVIDDGSESTQKLVELHV